MRFSWFLGSGKRDSNPRPSAWEANALPTELLPQKTTSLLDGRCLEKKERSQDSFAITNSFNVRNEPIAGLEPATHALRMRCSTN